MTAKDLTTVSGGQLNPPMQGQVSFVSFNRSKKKMFDFFLVSRKSKYENFKFLKDGRESRTVKKECTPFYILKGQNRYKWTSFLQQKRHNRQSRWNEQLYKAAGKDAEVTKSHFSILFFQFLSSMSSHYYLGACNRLIQ